MFYGFAKPGFLPQPLLTSNVNRPRKFQRISLRPMRSVDVDGDKARENAFEIAQLSLSIFNEV
jgi:hypothetical protein